MGLRMHRLHSHLVSSDRAAVGGRLASIGLVCVFLVLVLFDAWTTKASADASEQARRAATESDAFQSARYEIEAEESLEREYRLQAGPGVRLRYHEAGVDFVASLTSLLSRNAADLNSVEDGTIQSILADHDRYVAAVDQMFAAVDGGDMAEANRIDSAAVDPIFARLEGAVQAAAVWHRSTAAAALEDLRTTQDGVRAATPVAVIVGLVLLGSFWLVLRAFQGQLRGSEERFRALVQNSSDATFIIDGSSVVTYASPSSERVLGRDPSLVVGTNALAMVHPDDIPAARAQLEQAWSQPGASIPAPMRLTRADGTWADFEVEASNLARQPAVGGVVLTCHDVTERKEFERQLEHLAYHDPLTGLPNRALFLDRLDHAISRASRRAVDVAVLFLDLDNFKVVNDSLGHPSGDLLLRAVAERLGACIREEDTVARIGGDEFTVLLEETQAVSAIEVAERIAGALRSPIVVNGHEVFTSVSIGIAMSTPGRSNGEALLRNADLAMYRVKAGGRASHRLFDETMEGPARERLELETDLRHALSRDELRVFYQPIVLLDGTRVVEVEALVRWERPGHGLVAPEAFIPAAEETGLIVPLGQWVLEEACRQASAWQRIGHPLVMGVNLSGRQLQHERLVEDVRHALEASRLEPRLLKLEITESVAMHDAEATAYTMNALKELGVQLAIDDFGTGFSSLGYLKRFPIDTLKIDRSFISGLESGGGQDEAIIRSVVALAKTLNLSVTGEGIETAGQHSYLRSVGCDLVQGFLFARPMPAEEFGEMLAAPKQPASRGSDPGDHSAWVAVPMARGGDGPDARRVEPPASVATPSERD